MNKSFLIGAAKYGIGFALLGLVLWRNWDDISRLMLDRTVQVWPLLLAIVICLVSVLITFLRWYVLVRAQGLPITLANALGLGLVGFFFNICLPGSVGGDIVKAVVIAREQQRRTVAVATVIIDRVVGLWALVWLVAILGGVFWLAGDPGLHDHAQLQYIVLGAVAIVVLSTLAYLSLFLLPRVQAERLAAWLQARVAGSAAEFWRAIWMYRDQWRAIVLAMALSLVGHVGFVLTFYYSVQVFVSPAQIPSLTQHFLIVPIGMTIQAAIPIPGGLGVGEWGYGKLYALIGVPEANGVIGSLTQRMIFAGLGLVGYLVYLRMPATAMKAIQEAAADPEAELPDAVPTGSTDLAGAPETSIT